jgi:hypothetical protein
MNTITLLLAAINFAIGFNITPTDTLLLLVMVLNFLIGVSLFVAFIYLIWGANLKNNHYHRLPGTHA